MIMHGQVKKCNLNNRQRVGTPRCSTELHTELQSVSVANKTKNKMIGNSSERKIHFVSGFVEDKKPSTVFVVHHWAVDSRTLYITR